MADGQLSYMTKSGLARDAFRRRDEGIAYRLVVVVQTAMGERLGDDVLLWRRARGGHLAVPCRTARGHRCGDMGAIDSYAAERGGGTEGEARRGKKKIVSGFG